MLRAQDLGHVASKEILSHEADIILCPCVTYLHYNYSKGLEKKRTTFLPLYHITVDINYAAYLSSIHLISKIIQSRGKVLISLAISDMFNRNKITKLSIFQK